MIGEPVSPMHIDVAPASRNQSPRISLRSIHPRAQVPSNLLLTPVVPIQQFTRSTGTPMSAEPMHLNTNTSASEHASGVTRITQMPEIQVPLWQILHDQLGPRFPPTWHKEGWKKYFSKQDKLRPAKTHPKNEDGIIETTENTIFLVPGTDNSTNNPSTSRGPTPASQTDKQPLWKVINHVLGASFPATWYKQSWRNYFDEHDISTGHKNRSSESDQTSTASTSPSHYTDDVRLDASLIGSLPTLFSITPPQFRASSEDSLSAKSENHNADSHTNASTQGIKTPPHSNYAQHRPRQPRKTTQTTQNKVTKNNSSPIKMHRGNAKSNTEVVQKQSSKDKRAMKHFNAQIPDRIRLANTQVTQHMPSGPRPSIANSNKYTGKSQLQRREEMLRQYDIYRTMHPHKATTQYCDAGEEYFTCKHHRHLSLLPSDPTHDHRGNISYRVGSTIFS